jgi:hypothetical protein
MLAVAGAQLKGSFSRTWCRRPGRIDLVTPRGEPEGVLTTEEELDRGREPGPPGGGLEVSG